MPRRLYAALLLCTSCSTTRPLAPLQAGTFAAELSAPAVLTAGDSFATPVGTLLLGGRYGISDKAEVRLRLHLLPLAVGVVGIEGGGVMHVLPAAGWRPGLHFTGDLSLFVNPGRLGVHPARWARGAVAGAAIAHWELLRWLWPYIVFDNALMLYDATYVGSFFTGVQLRFARHWELSLETGIAGFNDDSAARPEPYVGFGGYGALWLSWGLAYRFGAANEVP